MLIVLWCFGFFYFYCIHINHHDEVTRDQKSTLSQSLSDWPLNLDPQLHSWSGIEPNHGVDTHAAVKILNPYNLLTEPRFKHP